MRNITISIADLVTYLVFGIADLAAFIVIWGVSETMTEIVCGFVAWICVMVFAMLVLNKLGVFKGTEAE